jgi:sugar/nucleoside kinase (ribokinase family)
VKVVRVGCVGMASIDTALVVTDPSYEHDAVLMVSDVVVSLGGKGLIAALAMAKEGVALAPLAQVGVDSRIVELLPPNIKPDWLIPTQAQDSRIWLTMGGAHRVTAWLATGSQMESDSHLVSVARRYVDTIDALYLAFESLPLVQAAFFAATASNKPTAINFSTPLLDAIYTHDPSLLTVLATGADLVICNESESRTALKMLGQNSWSQIVKPGSAVVVTEGGAGGRFTASRAATWSRYAAVAPHEIRSVVGAGDTFTGALIASYWGKGLSLAASCDRGARLASLSLTWPGSSAISLQASA